jgi:hypothetical protein
LFPKELPRYSRIFGRICGKSVKFLGESKSVFLKSEDTDILKMKNELQSSLSEIHSIRYEMRDSFRMKNPTTEMSEDSTKMERNEKEEKKVSFSQLYIENETDLKILKPKKTKNDFPFSSVDFEAPVVKELLDENSSFTGKNKRFKFFKTKLGVVLI